MTVTRPPAGPTSTRLGALGRWLVPLALAGGWFIAILLALLFIERDALRYVDWSEAMYQRFWPSRWLLAVHITGAGIALLTGPTQFSRTLRDRLPRLHRTAGWVYVVAVLVSTPFAVRLATDSCALCVVPFQVWGSLTILFTMAAVAMAIAGNYKAHRDFMIRSYILLYAFVFVRLDNNLLGTPLEVPGPLGADRGSLVVWYAWVVPLLVVEASISWVPTIRRVLKRRSGPRRTPTPVGR